MASYKELAPVGDGTFVADLASIAIPISATSVRVAQWGPRREVPCPPVTDRCRLDLVQIDTPTTTAVNFELRLGLFGSRAFQLAAGVLGAPGAQGMLFNVGGTPGTVWELWAHVVPGAAAVATTINLRALCDRCRQQPFAVLGILK